MRNQQDRQDICKYSCYQKYSRLRCLLRVKGLVICFYLGWSGSILQFRQNIIKVGSKSWLLTCSSNITLSLPSYTGSALKRELNFCNGYLSLLYFWTHTYLLAGGFFQLRQYKNGLPHLFFATIAQLNRSHSRLRRKYYNIHWTIYSATTFLESCRKVVREKWFEKSGSRNLV